MNGRENNLASQIKRGLIVIVIGLVIWYSPVPAGIKPEAWHLLAIFVATIFGLILAPLPMGAVVIIGLTMTTLTGIFKIGQALSGFANTSVWLIAAAFLFARAFIVTGLGRRISYLFIRAFGRKTLGLAYAVVGSELVLSPGIPSNTARAGGILFPIVRGLAATFGSEPGETARKIGAFLMQVEYQATVVTTAMFMTSAAANAFIADLANKTAHTNITWGTWAIAAIVPGLLSLILVTYLLYLIYPPEIKATPQAVEIAKVELAKMGSMKSKEKVLLAVFLLVLVLWITGQWTKIEATTVALLAVGIMLITGVLKWEDVLAEKGSWDALIWFGGLVMMAGGLNQLGLMKWFADTVGASVAGYSWIPALAVLLLVNFYVHYGFASLTAHITAMYAPFLLVALSTGAPPYLASLTMAFSILLCASLTHYGTGASPIYFNAGYMSQKTWWVLGFIVSVVNIVIWVGVGGLWWKVLGLW